MKNIRSLLKEYVFLLKKSDNYNINGFSYKPYDICYKSNACIIPINILDNKNIYEIIIPKPPLQFSYTIFTRIEWNNLEYKFISPLQMYQDYFIKSTIEQT